VHVGITLAKKERRPSFNSRKSSVARLVRAAILRTRKGDGAQHSAGTGKEIRLLSPRIKVLILQAIVATLKAETPAIKKDKKAKS
jgi:hypothetical protein